MKLSCLFFFLCLLATAAFAQDVHLSQYYTSNLSLNPALTGNYDGDVRVILNYRTQWRQVTTSPFRTSMVSLEKKIKPFALGIIFINDQISLFNINTNKALVAASYEKALGENIISLGVQAGFIIRSSNLSGQTFPEQWDYQSGNFDISIPNQEAALQGNTSFPGINAGLGWTRTFNETKVQAGYALFNITRPQDGFLSTQKLPFRHVFNALAVKPLNNEITIIPRLLYMRTASASDFIVGTHLRKKLKTDTGIMLGAGYRGSTQNSDAVIAYAGIRYRRFDFGFSSDITISRLSKDSQKSAYEFSISYTTPSLFPSKFTIPCDRY